MTTRIPLIEFKITTPKYVKDGYYWIAINGASCAASLLTPLSVNVQCTPTPETMIGFPTREEAIATQRFCLTGPIAAVTKRLCDLERRDDVVIKVFKHPEPPTYGPTMWIDGPMA